MKHNISIFFLVFTSYCLQISQQKLFLATIDTGKEELDKANMGSTQGKFANYELLYS